MVGECIVGFESFYNEIEDGIYDYFGNKDVRKIFVEDIYNYMFCVDLLDLFDYDVIDYKYFNVEDSIYDYVGVRYSLYGYIDLYLIEEIDYFVLL